MRRLWTEETHPNLKKQRARSLNEHFLVQLWSKLFIVSRVHERGKLFCKRALPSTLRKNASLLPLSANCFMSHNDTPLSIVVPFYFPAPQKTEKLGRYN
jgi:hypothetical protein